MSEAREFSHSPPTRRIEADDAGRFAGHAVATARVDNHAREAANYAVNAVAASSDAPDAADAEREWQREDRPERLRSVVTTGSEEE